MVCWFIKNDNPTGFLFLSRAAQIEQIMWFMCVSGEGAVELAIANRRTQNLEARRKSFSSLQAEARNKSTERDPDVREPNRFFVIIIHKQSTDSSGMKRNRVRKENAVESAVE